MEFQFECMKAHILKAIAQKDKMSMQRPRPSQCKEFMPLQETSDFDRGCLDQKGESKKSD